MFPVTITIANPAQLNAVLAALNFETAAPVTAGPAPEVAAAPVEKPKARTAAAAPAPQATTPAPGPRTAEVAAVTAAPEKTAAESSPTAAPVAAQQPASTAAEATYQDAAAAITKLSRTKGRDAAVAVLQSFGAAKLPDVKPEQFSAVIAAAEAAMKG